MNKPSGDRMIQIVLLCLIAAGILTTVFILYSDKMKTVTVSSSSGKPAGQTAAPGKTGTTGAQKTSAVAIEAERLRRGTVSQYIRVNGDVVSDISVNIYPNIQGKLVERRVLAGSTVTRGQIIAVVDPSAPGQVYAKSTITSTIDGTVTAVHANVGDTLGMSSPVVTVGDLTNLVLVTYIPERFVTYLETGLRAQVFLEAFPDNAFDAEVVQLSPVINASSRSLETRLIFIDPDPEIRVGMFATVRLVTRESRDCISVPHTALSVYYDDTVVFVIDSNNRAERRVVVKGLETDDRVEIVSGLSEGETVAIYGISSLTDGTVTRIVNTIDEEGK